MTFNLEGNYPFGWGYKSKGNTFSSPVTNFRKDLIDGMSFDENTKFYLCSDKLGTSPNACTITEFIFEYRYYGDGTSNYDYPQAGGKYRMISPTFFLSNF